MFCCCLCVVFLPVFFVASLLITLRLWIKSKKNKQKNTFFTENKTTNKPCTIGFFHPYCNAGGGGERVLWVAIKALQKRYDHVNCVVYTGDVNAKPEDILQRAKHRFNIELPRKVHFVYLQRRNLVEASTYPYFTLLGQSLGSVGLGWEALHQFVPDIYVDSMGYAFTLPLFKYIGGCQVGCYVHYPTISTDMLDKVKQRDKAHNNAEWLAKSPTLSYAKFIYYRLFAYIYGWTGRQSDIVMVNSSWTRNHIDTIWHPKSGTNLVFPPCDTSDFLKLPLHSKSSSDEHSIVSIAQFRPEKDHKLQLEAFHELLSRESTSKLALKLTLVLVGSCRDQGDEDRVKQLKALASELGIENNVQFKLNLTFTDLKKCIEEATIGLHTMWNEHFGIGVVELMAGGTVALAHNSGGPKQDIVVDFDGQPTGYLANDVKSYADAMETILSLSPTQRDAICNNARKSVQRFSDEKFQHSFLNTIEMMIEKS